MSELMKDYAVVAKVNVANMDTAVNWYKTKLGCELNSQVTQDPAWRQLYIPNLPTIVQIGLYQSPKVGTGSAAFTFVVKDIKSARNDLEGRGVTVSSIIDVGQGVQLAFFNDPDGNKLGLRQNSNGDLCC